MNTGTVLCLVEEGIYNRDHKGDADTRPGSWPPCWLCCSFIWSSNTRWSAPRRDVADPHRESLCPHVGWLRSALPMRVFLRVHRLSDASAQRNWIVGFVKIAANLDIKTGGHYLVQMTYRYLSLCVCPKPASQVFCKVAPWYRLSWCPVIRPKRQRP